MLYFTVGGDYLRCYGNYEVDNIKICYHLAITIIPMQKNIIILIIKKKVLFFKSDGAPLGSSFKSSA